MPRSETPLRSDLFPGNLALRQRHAGGRRAAHDLLGAERQSRGRAGALPAWRPGRRLGAGASPLLRSAVLPHRRLRPARLRPLDAAGRPARQHHGHLVADMERLRAPSRHRAAGCCSAARGAARWRWPTASAIPSRVMGFILRGIFLGARPEIDWFLHGMRAIFPEAWRDFAEHLPAAERADLLGNYYRRLTDRDPDMHRPAARAWSRYEAACSTLYPTARAPFESDHGGFALALSRIEAHYFANGTFVPEGWPWNELDKVRNLPDHHRAGPLRHRLPAGHRRCAGARLARGALRDRARRRPQRARARHPRRAGQRHRELPAVDAARTICSRRGFPGKRDRKRESSSRRSRPAPPPGTDREMARRDDWLMPLTPAEIAEIEAATRALAARECRHRRDRGRATFRCRRSGPGSRRASRPRC